MSEDVSIKIKVDSTQAEAGTNAVSNGLKGMGFAGVAAAATIVEGLRRVGTYALQTADEIKSVEYQLEATVEGFSNIERAMAKVISISQDTGGKIADVAKMYTTIADAAKAMGKSQADAERLAETVAKIKTAYAIDDEGFGRAMMQFSQALGRGVLQGDEFVGIMENARPLAVEMAEAIGVGVQHMKMLSTEGKLTSERMFQIANRLEEVTTRQENAPKKIATEWGKLVVEADLFFSSLDKSWRITEYIANTITKIKDTMKAANTPHEKKIYETGLGGTKQAAVEAEFISNEKGKEGQWLWNQLKNISVAPKTIDERIREHNLSAQMMNELETEGGAGDIAAAAEKARKQQQEADRIMKEQTRTEAEASLDKDFMASSEESLDSKIEKMREQEARKKEIQSQAEDEYKQSLERRLAAEKQAQEQSENEYAQSLARRQAAQQAANEADINENYRFSDAMRMIDSVKNQSLEKMDETTKKNLKTNMKKSAFEVLEAAGQYSKKMFEVSKALNLADTIMMGYTAVQRAIKDLPYPVNFGVAAITAAQAAIQIRGIQSQKFGGGGGFSPAGGGAGGSAPSGFGAISEQFGDNKKESPSKSVTINITGDGTFSSQQVRDLIKKIGEEAGNNVVIQAA